MAARQMQATTIRFGTTLHGALEEASESEGISFSQYVREAAVLRLAWESSQRDGTDGVAIKRLLELARNED